MENVPSKTARVKSALRHFSSHTVLSSIRTDSNKRSTKNVLSVEPIIRESTKTKSKLHYSNSADMLSSNQTDSSDRSTKNVSSVEPIIRERTKTKSKSRDLSSADMLDARRVNDSNRSTKNILTVETIPNDLTKMNSRLEPATHTGNSNVTNTTFAHSNKIKLTKHECVIFESVKEYLQGKKLNLLQLQDLRRQLSKPHTCAIVFRKDCRPACLRALQKTSIDIGIKVSNPLKAAAMATTAARRTGRSPSGSLSSFSSSASSSNRGKTSLSKEDLIAIDNGKEAPTTPHDASRTSSLQEKDVVPVAASKGPSRPRFGLSGGLPQLFPKAKAPSSIKAHKKKKRLARARRCLSVLPEAEEPYEAGFSVVPRGAFRVRLGLEPSDEDTWRRYAITAESLSALLEDVDVDRASEGPAGCL
ncbi:hypothetical protein MMC11_002290 [Xylographa trunciseda]|nr:hypothetical protein [Xylographa trunciseda]